MNSQTQRILTSNWLIVPTVVVAVAVAFFVGLVRKNKGETAG
jgi:hypothetical protein